MFQGSFDVQSKYLHDWRPRILLMDSLKNTLVFTNASKTINKQFALSAVEGYTYDPVNRMISINIAGARVYRLRDGKYGLHTVESIQQFLEKEVFNPEPTVVDTSNNLSVVVTEKLPRLFVAGHTSIVKRSRLHTPSCVNSGEITFSVPLKNWSVIDKPRIEFRKYRESHLTKRRLKEYYRSEDWHLTENGQLGWVNREKYLTTKRLLAWLVEQMWCKGSPDSISYPVQKLKPQSLIETILRCMGTASVYLQGQEEKLDRLKGFVAFLATFSIQFTDLRKPFSPILGETFQGYINGDPVYGEQISHKPSITALLYVGKGYRIWSSLQIKAQLGMKSGSLIFSSDVVLEYEDGNVFRGRLPSLELSTCDDQLALYPAGFLYAYDQNRTILCTLKMEEGQQPVKGCIGILKYQLLRQFIYSKNRNNLINYFRGYAKQDFMRIFAQVQLNWTTDIQFGDGTKFFYSDPRYLPYQLEEAEDCLPSHSNLRADIRFKQVNNDKQTQVQKTMLQQLQRKDARLRRHDQISEEKPRNKSCKRF